MSKVPEKIRKELAALAAKPEDNDVADPGAEFHGRRIHRPRTHHAQRRDAKLAGFVGEAAEFVRLAAKAFDLPDALEIVVE